MIAIQKRIFFQKTYERDLRMVMYALAESVTAPVNEIQS